MDEDFLRDLFRSVPAFAIRRMFGGQGLYSDGRIFALVIGGELYLKSDSQTDAVYEDAGFPRWRYLRNGREAVAMPYYRLGDEALDDPEEMRRWSEIALDVASRAAAAKPRKTAAKDRRNRRDPD